MEYPEIPELQGILERSVSIWSNQKQHGYTRVSLERYGISRQPRMTRNSAEQAGAVGKGQEKSRIVWKSQGYLVNPGTTGDDREEPGSTGANTGKYGK